MAKKLVLIPDYLPKTWLLLEEELKGKALNKHINNWKDSVRNIEITTLDTKRAEMLSKKEMRNKELK